MTSGLTVAVLGATGAVGRELLTILPERGFPVRELRPLASPRSAGVRLPFAGSEVEVRPVSAEMFAGVDVAFFSAGAARSQEWAPVAHRAGAVVIDNSSAFRMNPEVPLVVPEVNGAVLAHRPGIVSVPNCTAIILLMAIAPLQALRPIERLIVSTYQSASGAGAAAMEELWSQSREVLAGRPARPEVFAEPIAFNLFSHNTPIDQDGLNGEERKVIDECRRILGRDDLRVNVTCVRVPVPRAHTLSVTVEFAGAAPNLDEAREVLRNAPGLQLLDDRENNRFPTPERASGGDDVWVGRLRHDPSHLSGLCLMACGDQLRKGAALNAVQIAEALFPR